MTDDSIVRDKPGKWQAYEFDDTGYKCFVRKVSPALMLKLRREFPAPRPPMQTVDYGDEKGEEVLPNEADPDYQYELEAYNAAFEERLRRMYIRRGVMVQWTDALKEEVQNVRTEWKEETGKELDGSDEFVAVSYIFLGSQEDMDDLVRTITQRSFRKRDRNPNGAGDPEADVQGP